MYKGNITTATAVTATANVPFKTVWNTNGNTRYNATDNTVEILNPGKYNVYVMLNLTGTTGTVAGMQLYANGVAIPEALVQAELTASTGVLGIEVKDTIDVEPTIDNTIAKLSVRPTVAATVSNGIITVEKVR